MAAQVQHVSSPGRVAAAAPVAGAIVVHRTEQGNMVADVLLGVEGVHRSELPDWAGFVPELVSKIGDHVLAGDVADYVRMRAACRTWRSYTVDPRGLMHPRFFPRNWLMIKDAEEKYVDSDDDRDADEDAGDEEHPEEAPAPEEEDDGRHRFVNVRTGATFRIRLPAADEYGKVLTTSGAEGLLLLRCERTNTVRLLNPLTSAMAELPGLREVAIVTRVVFKKNPYGYDKVRRIPARFRSAGVVFDGDSPERPTVLLVGCIQQTDTLLYAKPGDQGWSTVDISCVLVDPFRDSFIHGGLSFRGQFYTSTRHGDLLRVELKPRPHLVYLARPLHDPTCCTCGMDFHSHLVPSLDGDDAIDNDGMLLVRRHWSEPDTQAGVFGVHVGASRFTPRTVLGDRAIFLPLDTLRVDKFPRLVRGGVYRYSHIRDII